MNSVMPRALILVVALGVAACSSTPPPKAQDYPEPVFAANRVIPADAIDVTLFRSAAT